MVTIRTCAVVAALMGAAAPVRGADADACARRARAAFEFAKLTAPRAPVLAPVPRPVERAAGPKLVGYREVCHNGRCYLVPVYEP